MSAYEPELGQAIFGGPWEDLECPPFVTAGLEIIAERIAEVRGTEACITDNFGEPDYSTGVFTMRTYCWCDGREHDEDVGCPPNFEHHESGLKARWYKHARRGRTINRVVNVEEWGTILAACMASLPSGVCEHERVYKPHPWAVDNPSFDHYWECSRCGHYDFGPSEVSR